MLFYATKKEKRKKEYITRQCYVKTMSQFRLKAILHWLLDSKEYPATGTTFLHWLFDR